MNGYAFCVPWLFSVFRTVAGNGDNCVLISAHAVVGCDVIDTLSRGKLGDFHFNGIVLSLENGDLGCDFLLAAGMIENAEDLGLELVTVADIPYCEYFIYVYKIS